MLSGEGLQRRENLRAIGAKLLVHHNAAVLTRHIPARPFLRLIHVRRENKLAQFASLQQASKTGRWVATEASEAPKIAATPFAAASACHRLENEDVLLDAWLRSLPNPMLSVTYRELFDQTFAGRVQDFLGVDASAEMRSPLAKQGQNRIIDRFAEPEEIERYFRETGRADWLGPEL